MAKSGFVFFDYKIGQVVPIPEAFRDTFPNVNWVA